MGNKYSDISNQGLYDKIDENVKEIENILQEIYKRQDDGRMKKGKTIEGSLMESYLKEQNKKAS